ncbi:MAG: N-acetyl sugar amidotransferase [Planctomycetaceae bacterium]|jgi:N-acetyl sugar amidotransferase|nr:N-acetyl sugar amidotransferase [Planctomycetaceae bacterium]MBT6156049.1 N-acetyl sugar amidotransferase [Planctomycetaceae bacterium]MBT6487510.1 N-acetyl sugar amidotransferase [Planctomycetaceae bacterium]MBT6495863.1 N-acetyl sugar amidotransferase [Planctomycetaceae bacterium]
MATTTASKPGQTLRFEPAERGAALRQCSRCIMDTTDPQIQFDEDGICNHCLAYDIRVSNELFDKEEDRPRLEELIAEIKQAGKGRDYDCIIGVSGGVDSTMVAYTAIKHGLRPLAVHMDNGWNSELAVANIERTLKTLGIDLYTHVVDWEEFRDLHLSFLKASVANSEIPTDHAIVAILYRLAAKQNVRFILGGGNLATEGIMPASWMYDAKDLRFLKSVHRRFGKVKLKTFPTFTLGNFAYWTFAKRIRTIPILNYMHFNKQEAIGLFERELGWRAYGGKHFESIYTRWFQAFVLPTKFGIDKRLAHLSSLIVSGQMTREQALAEMGKPLYDAQMLREDADFVMKKLGLNQSEFDEIMGSPVQTHRDFSSNELVLRRMPYMVKFVKKVATNRLWE